MPMTWNAEADAKVSPPYSKTHHLHRSSSTNRTQLMAKIIEICDVKLTAIQMAEVAKAMGPDCTPKALSHRMTYFRKLGANSSSSGPTTAITSIPKAKQQSKVTKPKATARGGKKAKAEVKAEPARTPSPSPGAGVGEEYVTPPATTRRAQRTGSKKRDYAELAGENDDDEDDDGEVEVGDSKQPRLEADGDGLNDGVNIEVGEDIGEGLRTSEADERAAEEEGYEYQGDEYY